MYAYRIHFKVDQFTTGERNDHLTLIDSAFGNRFLARSLPFIHTLIGTYMTNAIWIDLNQSIIAQSGAAQCRRCAQKATVRYFLNGFTNA